MAGRPPKEFQFKPGQSGNPKGPTRLPEHVKQYRRLTVAEVEGILHKYLLMDIHELQKTNEQMQADLKAKRETGISMIEAIVIKFVSMALIDGDPKYFDRVMDRTIGPVERRIKVFDDTIKTVAPIPLTDDEKLKMLDRFKEKLLDKSKPETTDAIEDEAKDITPRGD